MNSNHRPNRHPPLRRNLLLLGLLTVAWGISFAGGPATASVVRRDLATIEVMRVSIALNLQKLGVKGTSREDLDRQLTDQAAAILEEYGVSVVEDADVRLYFHITADVDPETSRAALLVEGVLADRVILCREIPGEQFLWAYLWEEATVQIVSLEEVQDRAAASVRAMCRALGSAIDQARGEYGPVRSLESSEDLEPPAGISRCPGGNSPSETSSRSSPRGNRLEIAE